MAKKTTTTKSDPFRKLVANYEFHDFKTEPLFFGLYKDTVVLGNDDIETDEEKTFTANIFVNLETGEEVYLGNSYAIAKAIKQAKYVYPDTLINDIVFRVEFLGKTEVKGKPFNRFDISECSLEEYEAMKSE